MTCHCKAVGRFVCLFLFVFEGGVRIWEEVKGSSPGLDAYFRAFKS